MQSGNFKLTWEEAVLWLKKQPDQAALVRDCYFDDPLVDTATRYYESIEWQAIRRLLLPAHGSALDIGSGRGISALALAKDGWETTALEPNSSNIVGAGAIRTLANDTHFPIKVVETWGEALPFKDSTFDLVHVRQALHHARDLRLLCREIARVLKPNGRLLATREHVLSHIDDLDLFLSIHPLHRLYGGENAFTLESYTRAIGDAGIHLTKIFNPLESEINTYPQTLGAIKKAYARRLYFPFPFLFPNILLSWIGKRSNQPGRLYTFFGRRTP